MGANVLVLGGWAVPCTVLKPLFGSDAEYLDVNSFIEKLPPKSIIENTWAQEICELYSLKTHAYEVVAGWSTGAIMAHAVSQIIQPQSVCLLSATPSFCRRDGFKTGMRTSVLDKMKQLLFTASDDVLISFYLQCGLDPEYSNQFLNLYTPQQLACGLEFLRGAHLFPVQQLPCKVHCIHGTQDSIIPVDAGKSLCDQTGGVFSAVQGPHAFFTGNTGAIKTLIKGQG